MNKFKSKDYHIIYIRYYASKYLLKKWEKNSNEPLPKQHSERARKYHDFFWKFFTHLTGIESKDWYTKYNFESKECASEELQERFGILKTNGESEDAFLIPKGKEDIFEWIKDNAELPYRVVTRMRHIPFRFYRDDCGLSDNIRKDSEEWSKEHGWVNFK